MWFLILAPIPTRDSNLILVTFGFSCSNHSQSFLYYSFLFFLGLHLNSREACIMLRLGYGWRESYYFVILHSFFPHLLRYISHHWPTKSLYLCLLQGLSSHVVSGSTDVPSISCCTLSFCPQSLARSAASYSQPLWGGRKPRAAISGFFV